MPVICHPIQTHTHRGIRDKDFILDPHSLTQGSVHRKQNGLGFNIK